MNSTLEFMLQMSSDEFSFSIAKDISMLIDPMLLGGPGVVTLLLLLHIQH
jgi:hypothetical protein